LAKRKARKNTENQRFTRRVCHFATLPHNAGPFDLRRQLPLNGSGVGQPCAIPCAEGAGHSCSSPEGAPVAFRWPGRPNRPQWVRWGTQKEPVPNPGQTRWAPRSRPYPASARPPADALLGQPAGEVGRAGHLDPGRLRGPTASHFAAHEPPLRGAKR
jgi:hypothetical protein